MFPRSSSTRRTRVLLLRRAAIALALAGCLVAPFPAGAGAKGPLPDLSLTSLDGEAIPPGNLSRSGRWLLVYVQPESGTSRSLLKRLEPAVRKAGPAVVVVVGASAESARSLAASSPALGEAAFYADPTHEAFAALGLRGAPVVLGIRDQTIEWTLAGTVVDTRTFESILTTWPR